jgi:pilus assembly protein Flp/PilA
MRALIEILRSEEGATSVEYAVVLALILVAVMGAIASFGARTGGLWGGIRTDLEEVGFGN